MIIHRIIHRKSWKLRHNGCPGWQRRAEEEIEEESDGEGALIPPLGTIAMVLGIGGAWRQNDFQSRTDVEIGKLNMCEKTLDLLRIPMP